MTRTRRTLSTAALFGLVLVGTVAVPFAVGSSTEHKLAVLDTNKPNPSSKVVRRYGRALDRLQRKCSDRRSRLGDHALTARRLLRNAHIDQTNLHILRAVYRSIPSGYPRRGCVDVFAAYVTLTKSG